MKYNDLISKNKKESVIIFSFNEYLFVSFLNSDTNINNYIDLVYKKVIQTISSKQKPYIKNPIIVEDYDLFFYNTTRVMNLFHNIKELKEIDNILINTVLSQRELYNYPHIAYTLFNKNDLELIKKNCSNLLYFLLQLLFKKKNSIDYIKNIPSPNKLEYVEYDIKKEINNISNRILIFDFIKLYYNYSYIKLLFQYKKGFVLQDVKTYVFNIKSKKEIIEDINQFYFFFNNCKFELFYFLSLMKLR